MAMAYESTIADLRVAIDRLESEKRQIDEQLRGLKSSLLYFESQDTGNGPKVEFAQSLSSVMPQPETSARGQRLGSDNQMRDAIADILATESPLHRQAIYDRLVERGVHIGGQKPVNNVGAHLSIDPRFTNVGRGIWALAQPHHEPSDDGDDYEDDSDGEEDSVPW